MCGCQTKLRHPAQPDHDTQADQAKFVLAPGYTTADLTNNPIRGAVRRDPIPTNTVFAPYDTKLVDAIQAHWYHLLDEGPGAPPPKPGQVIVEFCLHADGHVSGFRVAHNTSDEKAVLSCQKAVRECAPFAPWSPNMLQALTNGFRNVQFTFTFEP